MNQMDSWTDITGDSGFDLALVQNAIRPEQGGPLEMFPASGEDAATATPRTSTCQTSIGRISDRVEVRPYRLTGGGESARGALAITRPGTVTVADIVRDGKVLFTVASVYGGWQTDFGGAEIYSDASAHGILSDVSALMTNPQHRLIVSGDWNMLHGYGDHGDDYSRDRYQSVFDRAAALRLALVGPQSPNGRQANPWPDELPRDSNDVPTFYGSDQTPQSASRQLDYVFASQSLADRVHATALNSPEDWGPSDHCRIAIDVDL